MDYESLIDAETWAFIRKSAEFAPGNGVAGRRLAYDAMCRAFHRAYPEGVSAQDLPAAGVPARVYAAGRPTANVVYFHGGGFVVGGLESHDAICAEICAGTGYRVIAIDYRLAPEHRHPAAFEDAWDATRWVAAGFDGPLVLAGDSAGGTLAAAVAHVARGRLDRIIGQVLVYPVLGGDMDKGSFAEHALAPMLSLADLEFYDAARRDGPAPTGDPTWHPLQDTDFSGLPPTVLVTADCDPVRDASRQYRDRLRAAGVPVEWINETGLVHGYLRARRTVRRAEDSFERIVCAIEALGQGLWPYD